MSVKRTAYARLYKASSSPITIWTFRVLVIAAAALAAQSIGPWALGTYAASLSAAALVRWLRPATPDHPTDKPAGPSCPGCEKSLPMTPDAESRCPYCAWPEKLVPTEVIELTPEQRAWLDEDDEDDELDMVLNAAGPGGRFSFDPLMDAFVRAAARDWPIWEHELTA